MLTVVSPVINFLDARQDAQDVMLDFVAYDPNTCSGLKLIEVYTIMMVAKFTTLSRSMNLARASMIMKRVTGRANFLHRSVNKVARNYVCALRIGWACSQ